MVCDGVKLQILILSPLVTTALIDRMGDVKDKVREEAQNLTLKLMDEVAPPMVGLHLNEH
jgi:hypothetical protein